VSADDTDDSNAPMTYNCNMRTINRRTGMMMTTPGDCDIMVSAHLTAGRCR